MKRILIVMLALSSFPLKIYSLPANNNYQIIEATTLELPQEVSEDLSDLIVVEDVDVEPVMENTIETITISFAGDCTIGSDESYRGNTFDKVYETVKDPAYFFQKVSSIFANDDYTFINLEGTFTKETKKANKEFRYKGDPLYCDILSKGGIEGVTLANNHTFDYFQRGFDETVEILMAANIDYTYFEKYIIKEIKGIKVGFLGYKCWSDEKKARTLLPEQVKQMREQGVDFIIANYHWGDMYVYTPNAQQKNMAHYAIDNGVDLVIGHHPHVLQGMENYKGKNIIYSLGNFCYGGNMNPKDKDTIIYQQIILFDTANGEIVNTDFRIIPASMSSQADRNNYQPMLVFGQEGESILKKYIELSDAIK